MYRDTLDLRKRRKTAARCKLHLLPTRERLEEAERAASEPLKGAEYPGCIFGLPRQATRDCGEVAAELPTHPPANEGNERSILFQLAGSACRLIALDEGFDPCQMPVISSRGFT